MGEDIYPDSYLDGEFLHGNIDSWYQIFPVFECQNDSEHCAGGEYQELIGFVCLEIREIEAPDGKNVDPLNDGNKKLRVEFICKDLPHDPDSIPPGQSPPHNDRIDNCEINNGGPVAGGGNNGGLRATIPVLVR